MDKLATHQNQKVRYDWGLVVLGLCALQAAGTAQAQACSTTPKAAVYVAGMGGLSILNSPWVSVTGVSVRAKDANHALVPVCNARVTLKDTENNSYVCTTSSNANIQTCVVAGRHARTLPSTLLKVTEVLHAGVRHVVNKCQIQASRTSGWFGARTHSNLDCPAPNVSAPVAPPVSAPSFVDPK